MSGKEFVKQVGRYRDSAKINPWRDYMCKVTFNTNSGCLRVESAERSTVIGYVSFYKREAMHGTHHGEPDVECIRLQSPDSDVHIGSLYPDEIVEPKEPA